ncbi:MAG: potassium channel protein [Desulfobacterales bacterium]|jgi:voltage-gated potassium channel
MNILKRLYLVLLAIVLVIMAGSFGYYILFAGRQSMLDCIYMTVISLTTVGYGEVVEVSGNPPAQIFTMILIVFGMGIIAYGIGTLSALLIEGQLSGLLRTKKIYKRIGKLSNHVIVCGGGETGRPVLQELIENKWPVVLIEQDQQKIDRCIASSNDLLYIQGDATEDQNLIDAGLQRAFGLAICLPSDKDTLYTTITARMLNRKVRIICRVVQEKLKAKLLTAGANGVVTPSRIGALRAASELLRPSAVDFLDRMLRASQAKLRISEITVSSSSPLSGVAIGASQLPERFNLVLLAVRKPDREIVFKPPAEEPLEPGMTLIVMGDVEDCHKARKIF